MNILKPASSSEASDPIASEVMPRNGSRKEIDNVRSHYVLLFVQWEPSSSPCFSLPVRADEPAQYLGQSGLTSQFGRRSGVRAPWPSKYRKMFVAVCERMAGTSQSVTAVCFDHRSGIWPGGNRAARCGNALPPRESGINPVTYPLYR